MMMKVNKFQMVPNIITTGYTDSAMCLSRSRLFNSVSAKELGGELFVKTGLKLDVFDIPVDPVFRSIVPVRG